MDPATERLALEELNAAHRPQDLMDIDPEVFSEPVARRILERRAELGPAGFADLREVRGIDPRILDDLVLVFGPARRGRWDLLPYNVQRPDGSPYSTAHAALLHTGRVLFLPREDTTDTVLWDPANETTPVFEAPAVPAGEWLFCSGHTFLADGTLLTVGGGGNSSSGAIASGWKFDPGTRSWARTRGSMAHERWYPTAVTLWDGRVFVASGLGVAPVEIYDPSTDGFIPVTGPPGNPTGADRLFPETYPGLHLLPTGDLFFSRTGWGHSASEPTVNAALFRFDTNTTGGWMDVTSPMNSPDRTEGMSVLLLDGSPPRARVTVFGGGNPMTTGRNSAETIDFGMTPPTWAHPHFFPDSRFNANAVLLPDGDVLVVGGRDVQNSPALLFDPAAHTFSTMDVVKYRREYHSVALLLPSGKVMTTGGDQGNTPSQRTAIEVFSPPYLFRGPRPVVTAAPASVRYGDSFEVTTSAAADVARVVMVRPMAVTHHTDSSQRLVELTFTHDRYAPDRLEVQAPSGRYVTSIAPPGYYMLFVLNGRGVPSEARFVRLHE